MKFMIPLLMAAIPAAAVAQSQSEAGPGVPTAAIPKTTAVLVILTPRQGVTPQQIMAVRKMTPLPSPREYHSRIFPSR